MISIAALTAIAATGASAACLNVSNAAGYINYTTVTGYFLQDEPTTNASTFNYVSDPVLDEEPFEHIDLTTCRPRTTSA